MCQTVPAQQKLKCVLSSLFPLLLTVFCCVCSCVYRHGCESSLEFIPCTSVHFRDLGNLLAEGTKQLWLSDPVPADIFHSIAGTQQKQKDIYGNSACMLKTIVTNTKFFYAVGFSSPLSPISSSYSYSTLIYTLFDCTSQISFFVKDL